MTLMQLAKKDISSERFMLAISGTQKSTAPMKRCGLGL
jgi:hypothetical protein